MELKKLQRDALVVIEKYLSEVVREKKNGNKHAAMDAWRTLGLVGYQEKENGRGEDVPNFVMKIPTGGGQEFNSRRTRPPRLQIRRCGSALLALRGRNA